MTAVWKGNWLSDLDDHLLNRRAFTFDQVKYPWWR